MNSSHFLFNPGGTQFVICLLSGVKLSEATDAKDGDGECEMFEVGFEIGFLDNRSSSGLDVIISANEFSGDGVPAASGDRVALDASLVSGIGYTILPSSIDEGGDRRPEDRRSSNTELELDREPGREERSHVEPDDVVLMLALFLDEVEASFTIGCECRHDLNC